MKCVVPGVNAKILGRAIHALGRIGDELYIEPSVAGLSFRTVNSTKSAYAMVMFSPNFFSEYSAGNLNEEESEGIKCKIAMKSCLSVFKYPASMSKQVVHCKIKLDSDSSKLIFILRCRHDIVKTHYLTILDCETLQAVYTKEDAPNQLQAQTKVLSEAVNNFQASEEEITMEASQQTLLLRNYISHDSNKKVMRTELALKSCEFDKYKIDEIAAVTFSLKELRAVLNFAEALNLSLSISFEAAGRPIVFILNNESTFEANFVMATVIADETSQEQNESARNDQTNRGQKRPNVDCTLNTSKSRKLSRADDSVFNFTGNTRQTNPSIDFQRNIESLVVPNVEARNTNEEVYTPPTVLEDIEDIQNVFQDDFDDVIPSSPPKEKKTKLMRTVFQRCFEATLIHEPTKSQVLAEDSDQD